MTTPSDPGTMAASLAASLACLLAAMAAGARLRRLARLPLPMGLKAPCDFLTGIWLYGMAALIAGLLGLFRRPVLLGLVLALLACGRWRRTGWRLRRLWPQVVGCLILLPVGLAKPFFYDALVYHLALPWQALQEGRLAPHPEDLFSAFPPLAQLAFAAPIAAGLDRAAALLHLGAFAMAGAALAALARRIGATPVRASWAGATLPLLPAIVLVPGFPAAEGFAVAGVLAALALLLGGASPARRPVLLASAAAAGLLAGIATSARLQGLPWTGIVLLVVGLGPAPRARRLVAAGAGFVAGSAPWWLKNLLLLRDPMAPIAWRRPGVETLWRDSGALLHLVASPAGLVPALLRAAMPHLLYAGPLLAAALVAAVVSRQRRALTILLASGLGTVAWCLTGSLPRFWAPSLALLLALAAAAPGGAAARWLGGLAIALTAFLGLRSTMSALGDMGGPRLLLAGDAAKALVINSPLPAFEAAAALSPTALPPDALVLFVAEARAFGFPRRCIVPSQHDVSPLRGLLESQPDAASVRDALLQRGITHLLVNRAEMERLARGYPVLPWESAQGQARFQALLDLCGAPIVKAGETAIMALR